MSDIDNLLEEIKRAKELCLELGMDWDKIKTPDFVPVIMDYGPGPGILMAF